MYKFFIFSLLVAVSTVDSYSVYPAATYGYAPLAYAPVSARQSSSSLGPFFGFFPEMFGTPCAKCTCPPPPAPPTTPAAPATPAAASLTGYSGATPGVFGASASPSGTIAPIGLSASSSTAGTYVISAYDTSKTISITCTFGGEGVVNLKAGFSGTITPSVATTEPVSGTKYDVTGGYVVVILFPTGQGSAAWAPTCTWTTA